MKRFFVGNKNLICVEKDNIQDLWGIPTSIKSQYISFCMHWVRETHERREEMALNVIYLHSYHQISAQQRIKKKGTFSNWKPANWEIPYSMYNSSLMHIN